MFFLIWLSESFKIPGNGPGNSDNKVRDSLLRGLFMARLTYMRQNEIIVISRIAITTRFFRCCYKRLKMEPTRISILNPFKIKKKLFKVLDLLNV